MPGVVALPTPTVPARTQSSLEASQPDMFSPTERSFAAQHAEMGAYKDHQLHDSHDASLDDNAAPMPGNFSESTHHLAKKANHAASMNAAVTASDSALLLDSPPRSVTGIPPSASGVVASSQGSPVSTSFTSHVKHGSARLLMKNTTPASDADDSADERGDELGHAPPRSRRAVGSPIKALYELSETAGEQDKRAQYHQQQQQQQQATHLASTATPTQRSRLLEDPQAAYTFARARSPSAQEDDSRRYHQAVHAEQFADSSSPGRHRSNPIAHASESRLRYDSDGGRRMRGIEAKLAGLAEPGTIVVHRSTRVQPPALATAHMQQPGRLVNASSSDSIGTADLVQPEHQQDTSQSAALQTFYSNSGANTDLADWAPLAQPPVNATEPERVPNGTSELISARNRLASNHTGFGAVSPSFDGSLLGRSRVKNLPDWASLRDDDLTSYPLGDVRREVDLAVRELLNEGVFEQVLKDARARIRFRTYLAQRDGVEDKLDLVFDLDQYVKVLESVKFASEAIRGTYLADSADTTAEDLPVATRAELVHTLQSTFAIDASVLQARSHLARSLYENEFQGFVKEQLVEQTKVRLGSGAETFEGLGQAFCLTNPRMRDHPIVLTTRKFVEVTGYSSDEIVSRNCRFLQGPSTSLEAVDRIRAALNNGQGCCELLLNYTKNGKPFWNLLNILPLRDNRGQISYFIGGQTNVTTAISSDKDLAALLLGEDAAKVSLAEDYALCTADGYQLSPSLARWSRMKSLAGNAGGVKLGRPTDADTISKRSGRYAAGSLENVPSRSDLHSQYQADQPPERARKGNKLVAKLFHSGKKRQMPSSQLLPSAEAGPLRAEAGGLEEQVAHFKQVYGKLLILKTHKREIVFVSPELSSSISFSVITGAPIHNSPLLHADLLSLVQGSSVPETKQIRKVIQDALNAGETCSINVRLRQPSGSLFRSSTISDWLQVYLTPMFDRNNRAPFAYVAVLS